MFLAGCAILLPQNEEVPTVAPFCRISLENLLVRLRQKVSEEFAQEILGHGHPGAKQSTAIIYGPPNPKSKDGAVLMKDIPGVPAMGFIKNVIRMLREKSSAKGTKDKAGLQDAQQMMLSAFIHGGNISIAKAGPKGKDMSCGNLSKVIKYAVTKYSQIANLTPEDGIAASTAIMSDSDDDAGQPKKSRAANLLGAKFEETQTLFGDLIKSLADAGNNAMSLDMVKKWIGDRITTWSSSEPGTGGVGPLVRIQELVPFVCEVFVSNLDGLPPSMTKRVNPRELRAKLFYDAAVVLLGESYRPALEGKKADIKTLLLQHDFLVKNDTPSLHGLGLKIYKVVDDSSSSSPPTNTGGAAKVGDDSELNKFAVALGLRGVQGHG